MNHEEPCKYLGIYINARFNTAKDWDEFLNSNEGKTWDSHTANCTDCLAAKESWLESENRPIIEIKLRERH